VVCSVANLIRQVAQSVTVPLFRELSGEFTSAIADTGGGGGGDYVASAVHFDGTARLTIPSLSCTDNSTCSWAGFFKISGGTPGSLILWVSDPDDSYAHTAGIAALSGDGGHGWDFELGNVGNTLDMELTAPDLPSNDGVWHSIVASGDTLNNLMAVYVDDVLTAHAINHNGSSFESVFNGLGFSIGNDTFGDTFPGDVCNLWIAPGVSLLEPDGTISEAHRRKFVSATNKPVDPVNFPSSAILFSGDATGFATNQGTGGAFTLTGTLTNATTSPSD
jgi:hypothetical protein